MKRLFYLMLALIGQPKKDVKVITKNMMKALIHVTQSKEQNHIHAFTIPTRQQHTFDF